MSDEAVYAEAVQTLLLAIAERTQAKQITPVEAMFELLALDMSAVALEVVQLRADKALDALARKQLNDRCERYKKLLMRADAARVAAEAEVARLRAIIEKVKQA